MYMRINTSGEVKYVMVPYINFSAVLHTHLFFHYLEHTEENSFYFLKDKSLNCNSLKSIANKRPLIMLSTGFALALPLTSIYR